MADISKILDSATGVMKVAPEIYNDGAKDTIKESSKLISRIPAIINAALAPLDCWIAHREYNVVETKKLLEIKLADIEADKIVSPEPYIAVPALQAISYSMNSDVLRNMYANLLSKAMITDTKDSVHPSFVEIIKQLRPLDSVVFKTVFESTIRPVISFHDKEESARGYTEIIKKITWMINKLPISDTSISLDNLERLGLIEVDLSTQSYTKDIAYEYITKIPEYIELKNKTVSNLCEGHYLKENRGIILITDFAQSFYKICVCD